jgi:hypothetical protein
VLLQTVACTPPVRRLERTSWRHSQRPRHSNVWTAHRQHGVPGDMRRWTRTRRTRPDQAAAAVVVGLFLLHYMRRIAVPPGCRRAPSRLLNHTAASACCRRSCTNFSQGVMLTLPFTIGVYMVRAWEAKAGSTNQDEERISRMTGLLVSDGPGCQAPFRAQSAADAGLLLRPRRPRTSALRSLRPPTAGGC